MCCAHIANAFRRHQINGEEQMRMAMGENEFIHDQA